MNVEEVSDSAPNLRALPRERACEACIAICYEHMLKNKIHRLNVFAAKKWLIEANVGAKKKGA